MKQDYNILHICQRQLYNQSIMLVQLSLICLLTNLLSNQFIKLNIKVSFIKIYLKNLIIKKNFKFFSCTKLIQMRITNYHSQIK